MKKVSYTPVILIIIIALAAIAAIFISGCKSEAIKIENIQEAIVKGPPEIEKTALAPAIDEEYNPVEPTGVFPPGTGSIFLTVKFKNFTPDDNLKVVWSYLDTDSELSVQEYYPEESGSGNHFFNIKNSAGFQPGNYSVKIIFNGEVFEELDFIVE